MTSKQQMHSLEQFLAQAQGPSVSWADVDDDLEMYPNVEEPPSSEPNDHHTESASSRQSRHHRAPILPRSPPFVVYCGNLSFNCTEQNLIEFFAPMKVREVRLVIDSHTKRAKGFGYVEFHNRSDMERAFDRNAELLLNRPIRIDVQASRNHDNGGGAGSDYHRPQRHHTASPMHQSSGPPAERPKLALKPRTVDSNKPSDTAPTQRANPFGAARPREEVLKEKAKASTTTLTTSNEPVADRIQEASSADRRSPSPVQVRSNSAIVNTRTIQRPAWGPVHSVLSHQTPAAPTTEPSSSTPQTSSHRQAWSSRGATPRSNPDRGFVETGQGNYRSTDRHADVKQSGPNRHGSLHHGSASAGGGGGSGGHDRRGLARPQDQERRAGARPTHHPHIGSETKSGPHLPGHQDHRPRHHHHNRHDDRKASREKSDINIPTKQAEATSSDIATDRHPRSDQPRSRSPSHATGGASSSNADDVGFEMPRKGRRNGSGRSSSSSITNSMAKVDLNSNNSNNNRKEKNTSATSNSGRSWASRVQRPSHADIPTSVSYSSNMFSSLATDDD